MAPIAAAQQVIAPFDGTSLNGWKAEGTTASADAGVLTVNEGPGWVRHDRPLGNFTLTMDVRLSRAAKAGVYVRAWPTFDKETSVPNNGYRVDVTNDTVATQPPYGSSSWQRVVIVCSGPTMTVRINDREIVSRQDVANPQGFVALTVQGGTAEFRRIELSRPAPPRPQPRQGVSVAGGPVLIPRVVKEAKPQYTADAMRARIAGTVMLEVVVLEDGTVGDVDVVQSLDPHHGLDERAIATVKQWQFTPGTRDGKPVAVLVTIEMTFTVR